MQLTLSGTMCTGFIYLYIAHKQTCNLKLLKISIQTKKHQFLKYACIGYSKRLSNLQQG